MRVEGIGGVILVYPDGLTKEEGEERVVRNACASLDKIFSEKYGVEFVTTVTKKPAQSEKIQ